MFRNTPSSEKLSAKKMSKVYRFRLIQRVVRKLFSRINFRVLSLIKRNQFHHHFLSFAYNQWRTSGKVARLATWLFSFAGRDWPSLQVVCMSMIGWERYAGSLLSVVYQSNALLPKKKYPIKLPFQTLQHMLHRHYAFDRSPDNERTEYSVEGRHLHTLHSFLQACKNSRNI